ncbi:MAG: hypothetical protein JWR74_1729 [Polaromonas sp.]|jgi:curli production assembly/transport component CsgE|nr:hypothetical protein [Polaromonas sp.]
MRTEKRTNTCRLLAIAAALAWSQAGPSWAQPGLAEKFLTQGALIVPGADPGGASLSPAPLASDLHAGVVVNQTITLIGQDFYLNFVAAWRDKPLSERYTLSVHERPSARLGSQVWVEYGNRRVFQTFLPPARARAKDAGLDAVEVAYQNIVDADVLNLLFRDPDLGPDELKN